MMDKNKHKFMVQSIFAPDGEYNQDQLWTEADINDLMNSKLRCVFVLSAASAEQTNSPEVKVKSAAPNAKSEAKKKSIIEKLYVFVKILSFCVLFFVLKLLFAIVFDIILD